MSQKHIHTHTVYTQKCIQINMYISSQHQQISILERFLKDHVTLKTGVIIAAYCHGHTLHFKIETDSFVLIIYNITVFAVYIVYI